jgi:hypothetical protein
VNDMQKDFEQPESAGAVSSTRLLDGLRPITPDDVTKEGDRNYDLGRNHAMEELQPALLALERLFLSCAHLRLRCEMVCPSIKSYGDWSDNTKAMRIAENVLRPSNNQGQRPGPQ